MYRRKEAEILRKRIEEQRHFIQVIAGPRQVGKSTMVKQVLQDSSKPYLLALADEAPSRDPQWISAQWQQARQVMAFHHYSEMLLVIDEVHKLENWSQVVKAEWDKDSYNDLNLKVVLLGSSRLLLMDGLNESLAGRFELINLLHWSYTEMNEAFGMNMNQYVYFGGYPGGAPLIDDETRWRKYILNSIVEPAISKDVLLTKRIYKPALLRQLFLLGCSYSGELLSFNKMLGQLQDAGNTDTLATYLRVLDESCLLNGLMKYSVDNARKYMSIPKYQVYNTALMSVTSTFTYEQVCTSSQWWGRWVESTVGAYLVNNARDLNYSVYYWRERAEEVDFVLVKADCIAAIEVKSGRRTTNSGIFTFADKYHPRCAIVVGGESLTLEQFLRSDIDSLFSLMV